jgi:hypothetical protein
MREMAIRHKLPDVRHDEEVSGHHSLKLSAATGVQHGFCTNKVPDR